MLEAGATSVPAFFVGRIFGGGFSGRIFGGGFLVYPFDPRPQHEPKKRGKSPFVLLTYRPRPEQQERGTTHKKERPNRCVDIKCWKRCPHDKRESGKS